MFPLDKKSTLQVSMCNEYDQIMLITQTKLFFFLFNLENIIACWIDGFFAKPVIMYFQTVNCYAIILEAFVMVVTSYSCSSACLFMIFSISQLYIGIERNWYKLQ